MTDLTSHLDRFECFLITEDRASILELVNEVKSLDGVSAQLKADFSDVVDMAVDVLDGNHYNVLTSPGATEIYGDFGELEGFMGVELFTEAIHEYLKTHQDPDTETVEVSIANGNRVKQLAAVVLGMSLLMTFVQVNWSGPSLDSLIAEKFESFDESDAKDLLVVDGEALINTTEHAIGLVCARSVLVDNGALLTSVRTASLWYGRCLKLHQGSLLENTFTLFSGCVAAYLTAVAATHPLRDEIIPRTNLKRATHPFPDSVEEEEHQLSPLPPLTHFTSKIPENLHKAVGAHVLVEAAIMANGFKDSEVSHGCVDAAKELTGLNAVVTGASGKRTKFQEFTVSQMVVRAVSKLPAGSPSTDAKSAVDVPNPYAQAEAEAEAEAEAKKAKAEAEAEVADDASVGPSEATLDPADQEARDLYFATPESSVSPDMPMTLKLNDDTRLEKITLEDNDDAVTCNLATIDQCILLGMCLNVENSNPRHGLTSEQMMPFVLRVLENPNAWLIHSTSLLVRARIELPHTRTAHRSLMQIQALIDQHKLEEPAADTRISHIFSTTYPSLGQLRLELADMYERLGILRSALEMYMRLDAWEKVIGCYVKLDEKEKATKLIREQMALRETAALHAALGDVSDETVDQVKHYTKAWEFSKGRHSRSKRCLGVIAMRNQHWAEAAEHFLAALKVNPIFPGTWYSRGCCLMQMNLLDEAASCFTRVVSINEDDYEAWNNLAACYTSMGKKDQAFWALSNSVKLYRDNPNIWKNFAYVAMDCGRFTKALIAVRTLGEISQHVEMKILRVLVNGCVRGAPGMDGPLFKKNVSRTLEALRLVTSTHPGLWELSALFARSEGETATYVKYRESHTRSVMKGAWERSEEVVSEVCESVAVLVDLYSQEDTKRSLYKAQSQIRIILARTKDYSELEGRKGLEVSLEELTKRRKELMASDDTDDAE